MSVRIVVRLKMCGGLLASKAQIVMRVFLGVYREFLDKKSVKMSEIDLFSLILVSLGGSGMSWSVGIVGLVVDEQFWIFMTYFFQLKLCSSIVIFYRNYQEDCSFFMHLKMSKFGKLEKEKNHEKKKDAFLIK